jgi:hypothetical protein
VIRPLPFPPALARLKAKVDLRFEDVSQEGRLLLQAVPSALGATLWNLERTPDPVPAELGARGVIPILSRFQIVAFEGPISALVPMDAEWSHQLAATDQGRVAHDAWLELHGVRGRTYGTIDRAGERLLAGHLYAEQILTRPFAAAGERRVTAADVESFLGELPRRRALPSAVELFTVPAGATPLELAPSADVLPLVFGLVHTDSNQHVNSLAYFRVFEEAALRRLDQLGRPTRLLGREVEVVYRKPCFAGNRVRVVQQAFEHEGKLGVCATLVDDEVATDPARLAEAKPYTYARMLLSP